MKLHEYRTTRQAIETLGAIRRVAEKRYVQNYYRGKEIVLRYLNHLEKVWSSEKVHPAANPQIYLDEINYLKGFYNSLE